MASFNAYTHPAAFMSKVKKIWRDAGFLEQAILPSERQDVREAVLEEFCDERMDMYGQWQRYTPNGEERDTQCICSTKCKRVDFLQNIYDPSIVIQVGRDCVDYFYEGERVDEDDDLDDFIVPDEHMPSRTPPRMPQPHQSRTSVDQDAAEQRRIIAQAADRLREIEQRRAQERRVADAAARAEARSDDEVLVYMKKSDINQMARDLGRQARVYAYNFV
jgi:hypothetical protein